MIVKMLAVIMPKWGIWKVWNALKILDAADADNPEASLGIVEIYSLRVVSKGLAGKPEGWNSELANFIFWSYIVLVLSF
ncbi:hypothetical protein CK203_103999 [Vitis vinifera]|uniref:Uncharacterized protein n=1 Tax=Vitis vinifera TaxID=29760 RepID=A0A438CZA1_VITVI|nr:hypothetical protein CK203_103999 [Vitis vinifera]